MGPRRGRAAAHRDRQGAALQVARNPGARAGRQGLKFRFSRICMGYAISLWTPPALPIAGSAESFPVRRIFCVGRNYAEHQKEERLLAPVAAHFLLESAHS